MGDQVIRQRFIFLEEIVNLGRSLAPLIGAGVNHVDEEFKYVFRHAVRFPQTLPKRFSSKLSTPFLDVVLNSISYDARYESTA